MGSQDRTNLLARERSTGMTPNTLSRKIQRLRPQLSITTEFERALERRGSWSENHWYTSQKEHWIGWLSKYGGPGAYGRKNSNRSAEFIYNHIVCPPMVLWLTEAVGFPRVRVIKAKQAALSASPHFSAQCAAIRRIIPWQAIETRLNNLARKV